ncbi:hypothetical protein [Bradyrhizobium cenepequi]|uniref:hypothetical protein n=1 Tax=Bradyrhizobium cenepequi TaxID=2821403 RepID=UPI001CE30AFB|nr:hypothetical protein [Bradyrhizobium cenepequi]MCA6107974.1 hypothetical protein [Bradyrhizobium cenepequi]
MIITDAGAAIDANPDLPPEVRDATYRPLDDLRLNVSRLLSGMIKRPMQVSMPVQRVGAMTGRLQERHRLHST